MPSERPVVMCRICRHPNDQHSVYRDLCLIKDCTCTRCGGLDYSQFRQSREKGFNQ